MAEKKCAVIMDGKECGLELIADETEEAKLTGRHECAFGHRTYILDLASKAKGPERN